MGETQASHNWRGNETFSKPRPFRDEVIDGEVMTPEWMVDDMLTALDACDTSLSASPISNPDVPLLDMCGGTGNFTLSVAEHRARSAGKPADAIRNVRMIELDEDNIDIARQRCMLALRDAYGELTAADEIEARHILEKNFICGDALRASDVMSPDKCRVIVSNPPYPRSTAYSGDAVRRKTAEGTSVLAAVLGRSCGGKP